MAALDHLVLASPDPLATRTVIAEHTGVLLSAGGAHVGLGTRNWLGGLGPGRYLELIGPDPEQPEPSDGRPFGVDDIAEARLVTWCARHDDLDGLRRRAAAAGVGLGAPFTKERDAPDGRLRWRLCLPGIDTSGGIVPFFIDWDGSAHPSRTAVAGLSVVGLGAEHPDPPAVRRILGALGVELPVAVGPAPRLVATLRGPAGQLRLGSTDESAVAPRSEGR
ncbi:MAG: VOC family protein [Ilumatobacteraceae bacterium]